LKKTPPIPVTLGDDGGVAVAVDVVVVVAAVVVVVDGQSAPLAGPDKGAVLLHAHNAVAPENATRIRIGESSQRREMDMVVQPSREVK
jgi:hypothetical protein